MAFPAISTGVYGYPSDEAAAIAVATVREAISSVHEVLLVAFDPATYRLYETALQESHGA